MPPPPCGNSPASVGSKATETPSKARSCHRFVLSLSSISVLGTPTLQRHGQRPPMPSRASLPGMAFYGHPSEIIAPDRKAFRDFAKCCGFVHLASSPRHSRSHSEAERTVRTIEDQFRKAKDPFTLHRRRTGTLPARRPGLLRDVLYKRVDPSPPQTRYRIGPEFGTRTSEASERLPSPRRGEIKSNGSRRPAVAPVFSQRTDSPAVLGAHSSAPPSDDSTCSAYLCRVLRGRHLLSLHGQWYVMGLPKLLC